MDDESCIQVIVKEYKFYLCSWQLHNVINSMQDLCSFVHKDDQQIWLKYRRWLGKTKTEDDKNAIYKFHYEYYTNFFFF